MPHIKIDFYISRIKDDVEIASYNILTSLSNISHVPYLPEILKVLKDTNIASFQKILLSFLKDVPEDIKEFRLSLIFSTEVWRSTQDVKIVYVPMIIETQYRREFKYLSSEGLFYGPEIAHDLFSENVNLVNRSFLYI